MMAKVVKKRNGAKEKENGMDSESGKREGRCVVKMVII